VAEGLDGRHQAARTVIAGNTVATAAIRGEALGDLEVPQKVELETVEALA
jgi:hypothetical protein